MARWNQHAGRTPSAWWARYNERKEILLKQIEALKKKGMMIEFNSAEAIGGPGVPGDCLNSITAVSDGKILTRKQVRKLCLDYGIKLNNHSYPVQDDLNG